MKFILGKKIEMTQVWKDEKSIAITKIQAGPCGVVQVKNEEKDGYKAVQIGFGIKKEKNIKKPQKGHLKGLENFRYLKEFRITDEQVKKGDIINVSSFAVGDIVRVAGTSKGKGFQGVVKRWGFAGQIKTHGNKDQLRMPGSIGATGPAHVFKGTRMGGRMGGERVTTTNLEIIDIDLDNNIISIKGSVPGSRNGLVEIKGEGELKVIVKEEKNDNANATN
ncbi:50S ribosomal protein L3 [Candidatus Parcubacteria bacterium]|nr:50S ribosomal protein L3 [Candidatus Parcubacteria bacterium]